MGATWGDTFWCAWQVMMVLISATGQRLVGKHKSVGWVVCLVGSSFWIIWGVVDGQLGALLNGMVFGSVYMLNLVEWTSGKEKRRVAKIWLGWLAFIFFTFASDAMR